MNVLLVLTVLNTYFDVFLARLAKEILGAILQFFGRELALVSRRDRRIIAAGGRCYRRSVGLPCTSWHALFTLFRCSIRCGKLYLDLLCKNMFFNRIRRAAAAAAAATTDNPISLTFTIRLGNVNKVGSMLNGRYTAFSGVIPSRS